MIFSIECLIKSSSEYFIQVVEENLFNNDRLWIEFIMAKAFYSDTKDEEKKIRYLIREYERLGTGNEWGEEATRNWLNSLSNNDPDRENYEIYYVNLLTKVLVGLS